MPPIVIRQCVPVIWYWLKPCCEYASEQLIPFFVSCIVGEINGAVAMSNVAPGVGETIGVALADGDVCGTCVGLVEPLANKYPV